jgi:hypothetical protein
LPLESQEQAAPLAQVAGVTLSGRLSGTVTATQDPTVAC